MDTMIDIIGSTIVAGLLIVAIVRMNSSLSNTGSDTNVQVITQSDLTAIGQGITYDFYKIGYRASPAILIADTNRLEFRADLEKDGVPDTVYYYTAQATTTGSQNPNMIVLYRRQWNSATHSATTTGASLGQTYFNLSYYDSTGTPVTIPPGGLSWGSSISDSLLTVIKTIQVKVLVQSPNRLMSDTTYAGSYWEQYISPKNLRTLM